MGWLAQLLNQAKQIFGTFAAFASSPAGGLILNQVAAGKDIKDWDEFEQQVQGSNQQAQQWLKDYVGVGEQQYRPGSNASQLTPRARAELDRRIAAGEDLGHLAQYAEAVPSAFQQAINVSEQGLGLSNQYYNPDEAQARFEDRYSGVTKGLEGLAGEVSTANDRVAGMYTATSHQLRSGSSALRKEYDAILNRARGLVENLGQAERQDINRRFTESGNEAQMALSARGLGGSTISSSLGQGVERERSTALLGLQEQVAKQKLGVEETFGLPGLSAQERLLGARVNLGAQQAQSAQAGNQFYANAALQSLGALGNIAGGSVGAWDQAAYNRLANLGYFGQIPVSTQMQGAGMGLNWQGGQTLIAPQQGQYANIYPSF